MALTQRWRGIIMCDQLNTKLTYSALCYGLQVAYDSIMQRSAFSKALSWSEEEIFSEVEKLSGIFYDCQAYVTISRALEEFPLVKMGDV
jgi:hypothetical protein